MMAMTVHYDVVDNDDDDDDDDRPVRARDNR